MNTATLERPGYHDAVTMGTKTYRMVALRFAYETAMRSAKEVNGCLEGELPLLFDQDEAAIACDLVDDALRKLLSGSVRAIKVTKVCVEDLQDTFRIRFVIQKN